MGWECLYSCLSSFGVWGLPCDLNSLVDLRRVIDFPFDLLLVVRMGWWLLSFLHLISETSLHKWLLIFAGVYSCYQLTAILALIPSEKADLFLKVTYSSKRDVAYKQLCTWKPALGRRVGNPNQQYSLFWFPWCKYSNDGPFQAINSLTTGFQTSWIFNTDK